jgi:glucose/arabinose dehydrogenase
MKTPAPVFAIIILLVMMACTNKPIQQNQIPETDGSPTSANISGNIFKPAVVKASDSLIQQLKVPAGFTVNKFASDLGKPRIIVIDSAGHIYVSDREAGVVLKLEDKNKDGISDGQQTVATIRQAHGLAVHQQQLFITSVTEVYVSDINADGSLSTPKLIIKDLPDGGQHPNRTIAVGPDNLLYISVGSTCNACDEPNKINATMLRANLDGTNQKVYAKGLRNTIGYAWHPQTKELWSMDHGIDWLGDDEQKEEVNLLKENGNYGWPYIFGEGKYNPGDRPPGDTTYEQYLKLSTLPTLTYDAHAAPMQWAFYDGTLLPAEYRHDAFIAMHGSWNRAEPRGYKLVHLEFENGQPVKFNDFLTGFLTDGNKAVFGRPVGVAVSKDGSLLVSDDIGGIIYRIARK